MKKLVNKERKETAIIKYKHLNIINTNNTFYVKTYSCTYILIIYNQIYVNNPKITKSVRVR